MTDIRQIRLEIDYKDGGYVDQRSVINGPGDWDRQGGSNQSEHANALTELVANLAPHAVEINRLLDEHYDWANERAEYSEHDGEPDGPSSSNWQDNDDAGIELLAALVGYLRTEE